MCSKQGGGGRWSGVGIMIFRGGQPHHHKQDPRDSALGCSYVSARQQASLPHIGCCLTPKCPQINSNGNLPRPSIHGVTAFSTGGGAVEIGFPPHNNWHSLSLHVARAITPVPTQIDRCIGPQNGSPLPSLTLPTPTASVHHPSLIQPHLTELQ